MSAPSVDIIRWGRQRARTWPWRGDGRVAFLALVPSAPVPSADFAVRCLDTLAERGFARVVTAALSPIEQAGFLAAGFEVAEELHLLALDLDGLPARPTEPPVSRVHRDQRPQVLAIDRVAFAPFWQLDDHGLDDALGATPRSHFRGVTWPDVGPGCRSAPPPARPGGPSNAAARMAGYAICGRSGPKGFVQRLAVVPEAQRRGVGRALLIDGLHWMRRRGVRRAVVNTQVGNDAALMLYRQTGFQHEPSGLSVLAAGLR